MSNDGRCLTCKFIAHGISSYTYHNTGEQKIFYSTLPCQHIGQTCHTLRKPFGEQRRRIENNIDESVPIRFNQPKHTLDYVQVIPLLHVNSNRDSICFSMEQHLHTSTL